MVGKLSLSDGYWKALHVSLVLQGAIGFPAAIAIDGGFLFNIWWRAMAAYWGGFLLIRFRRPNAPTTFDLFLIRWGFAPLLFIAPLLSGVVWRLMGVIR